VRREAVNNGDAAETLQSYSARLVLFELSYRRRTRLLASTALLALVYLIAQSAQVQDIELRKWSDTLVGVNFLIFGYAYTRGGISLGLAAG
jgi:hypothetical protein